MEAWLTFCHTYPNLLFTVLHAKWGHKFRYVVRIQVSCAIMLVALAVIPWIENTPGVGYPPAFYFTMIGVFVTGTLPLTVP